MASTIPTLKHTLRQAGYLLTLFIFPVSAHATGLQLYGALDGGYRYHAGKTQGHFTQPSTGQSTPFSIRSQSSGMASGLKNDSKIGLRGTHEIGGGNRIFFELEEEVDIATGRRARDRGVRVIGIGG